MLIFGKCKFIVRITLKYVIKPTDKLLCLRTCEVYCEIYIQGFSENITKLDINREDMAKKSFKLCKATFGLF